MKIRLILFILLVVPSVFFAMEKKDIIPKASYFIIKGNEQSIEGGIGSQSTHVTFYDAAGNELKKLSKDECDLFHAKEKLDPTAPKPKVATYAIKWWPAIPIGWGMRKGVPGYFVVLKDKHGNYIARFRYNEKTKKITISYGPDCEINSIHELKDFDTTNCVEHGSELK